VKAPGPAKLALRSSSRDRLFGGGRGARRAALALTALTVALTAASPSLASKPSAATGAGGNAAGSSIVAQGIGKSVAIYRSPGASKPFLRLSNPNADGVRLVFLVKQRVAGWEQVRLPIRPNGSTGWVRDASVNLVLNPYRVAVSLSAHRITVWNDNHVIRQEPAGVGRSVLPTPIGVYYIVELLKEDPRGPYGPYAFGLSAFSNVLFNFGGGPGQIGLHGTDDPGALGTNVSHGCIRISNTGIAKLARLLPLGTEVRITP
jgi:lipoprotein-anchoring transpeptidase ErfK/SrfK